MQFKNGPLQQQSKLLGTLWSVSSSLVPDDSSLPLSPLHTQQKFKIESSQKKERGQKNKFFEEEEAKKY